MEPAVGANVTDAPTVTEVGCAHAQWWILDKAAGCIHSDHGPWPPDRVDIHSGVRMVDGVPRRYSPKGST